MTFLIAVAGLLTSFTVMVAAYHTLLAIVAICKPRTLDSGQAEPAHSFAIVIPAHNEEEVIGLSLESCSSIVYPPDRYRVFVIADNCTDHTADVARAHGAVCLERTDPERRGKGHALSWAFERVLRHGFDAIVVLDADCTVAPEALRVFDRRLAEGDRVLQADNVAANPEDSPISYAAALANSLENDLFYTPKSALGLAVFLRGTGMVIHRSVLEEHPWNALSIVEDMEYTLRLLRHRIRVRYVPEVWVRSPFPSDGHQLSVQRARWVGGTLSFSRTRSWALMFEGILGSNLLLADAGWTLLNVVRSLLIVGVAITLAANGVLAWIRPGPVTTALLVSSSMAAAALVAYVALGIVRFGLTASRVKSLLKLPVCMARMMAIAARGLIGLKPNDRAWTPRPCAESAHHPASCVPGQEVIA
jgi:cellulose synthase/poly-beta-1,6-N-acetylglucosamine synthase-like glycosyltransferase